MDVFNAEGQVDWGVAVHAADQVFQSKGDAVSGGLAWLGGPGASEFATCQIPVSGWYCIAVWKSGSDDLGWNGSYTLQVRPLTTDTPADTPARTALSAVYPNPLQSATKIDFALAKPGVVQLDLFDLHGARVRSLTNQHYEAGRFQLPWSGVDDRGRSVAPGVYFVRFVANGTSTMRRIVKME